MEPRSIFKKHFSGDKYDLKDLIDDELFLFMIKPAFLSSWLGHGSTSGNWFNCEMDLGSKWQKDT